MNAKDAKGISDFFVFVFGVGGVLAMAVIAFADERTDAWKEGHRPMTPAQRDFAETDPARGPWLGEGYGEDAAPQERSTKARIEEFRRNPPTCLPGYTLDLDLDYGVCVRTIEVPLTCEELRADRHLLHFEGWIDGMDYTLAIKPVVEFMDEWPEEECGTETKP